MTETAKREVSMEDEAEGKIATDDPLFELSQIMGLDDDTPAEPSPNIDSQIDLEDALLAEMTFEPEVDAPSMVTDDPAPTAESLEDELTTMLGGAVSVAAEVPAPDVESEPSVNALSDAQEAIAPENFGNSDEELEAAQLSEAVADSEIELDEFASEIFPEAEVVAQEFETPFDGEFVSDGTEPESSSAVLPEDTAPEATLSIAEAELELEKDFAAFFDEELPDSDLEPDLEAVADVMADVDVPAADNAPDLLDEVSDLVTDTDFTTASDVDTNQETVVTDDVLAHIAEPEIISDVEIEYAATEEVEADLEPETAPEMASVEDVKAVSSDIEQLNAGIEKIFGEQFASLPDEPLSEEVETAEPELPAAPILETTDMSSYESANAIEVDVPELPDLENEFVAAFESDAQSFDDTGVEDDDADASGAVAAMGATVAAAGATILSRSAGETAMAADDEAFDETRFEAELARDMEFVSHDLGNSEDDDLSFDQDQDDAALAAHAAANKPAKRGLVIAAALGCIAIAGAAGIFVYSNGGIGETDGPILVEASSDPVKIEPENPGGKLVPNQDRAVFAENPVVPEQEALVPGVEEPVDIAAVPEAALPSSLNGGDLAQKGEDRLIPAASETTAANDEIGALLAPRKVRTLVVKPDGTLVERAVIPTPEPVVSVPEPVAAVPEVVAAIPEAEAASAFETPVAPTVAEVEPETVTPEPVIVPEPVNNGSATSELAATTPAAPDSTPTAQAPAAEVAAAPAIEPEVPAANAARSINNPPTIADRPNDQPLNIVNPVEQAANTQVASAPAPAPAPAPAAPVANAAPATPFSVQLASLPSQAAAQDSANNLARQYSSLIGNRGLAIREAQIEGRGTFYQVRVGASSRDEANQLCGQIKAAGGDCFVTR